MITYFFNSLRLYGRINAADGDGYATFSKAGTDLSHPLRLQCITRNPYKIALDIPMNVRDIFITKNVFNIQISGCQGNQRQKGCILHKCLTLAHNVKSSPHGPEIIRRLWIYEVYFHRR